MAGAKTRDQARRQMAPPVGIVPALSRKKMVFFTPYNKSVIDQACSVKSLDLFWPVYGPRQRHGPQTCKTKNLALLANSQQSMLLNCIEEILLQFIFGKFLNQVANKVLAIRINKVISF